MSVIGTLSVNVLAKTSSFDKGIAGSRIRLSEFKRGIVDVNAKLNTFGKLVTGSVVVGGLFKLTHSLLTTAQQLDHVAKTSAKLGIATEQLQSLTHAADLTGVGAVKLEMALQRMTRRTAEAAQGTGEAVKAYEELNLNAAELVKLSPEKTLYRIADAMQTLNSESDRIRVAFKLFDSEGVDLVNTLKDGSASLQAMQKEAFDLGIAVSGENLGKIEKFNDEMTRLKAFFTSAKMSLVIDIAPAAAEAVEGIRLVLNATENVQPTTLLGKWANWNYKAAKATYGPLLTGGNENNSLIYRASDALFRRLGAGMGGNDAANIDWAVRSANHEIDLIHRERFDKGTLQENAERDARWAARDAADKQVMQLIRRRSKEAVESIAGIVSSLPKLRDSFVETANKISDLSRSQFFKQSMEALGFGGRNTKSTPKPPKPELVSMQFRSGAGSALEYGTAEAFRAARANQNPVVTIVREQLAEAKRQTDFLKQIAEQEPIVIQEEG